MRNFGSWLVLVVMAGCSKSQPPDATVSMSKATSPDSASTNASSSAEGAPELAAAVAPAAAAPPASAPTSFKGGAKETVANAVGLGCEATSLNGWLELLCRKKNGTGGHPLRATLRPNATAEASAPTAQEPGNEPDQATSNGDELSPNAQGELRIVVPFSGDEQRDVAIEWTDTSYTLHVTGAKATLEWAAAGIEHRRACQQLLDESKAAVVAGQKLDGEARLTTTEASKLPRFGLCQPAGLGSWAVALKSVRGKGEGAARAHHLELDVVHVDLEGGRKSASFGSIDVAPGGFELASLRVYDYDDDGHDELIVPYELKASADTEPSYPAPIWSFNDAGVVAYAKAPGVNGGIAVEQLDFDMRPDFAGYGPFVAFLGADCGLKSCPTRLVGPKFFLHSTPEGAFTDADEATRAAFKRTGCQSKPSSVVASASGNVNAAQTAKNLVCARAYGVSGDGIAEELRSKHAALCGEAETCPLQTTLEAWLRLPLPIELPPTSATKK